MRSPDPEPPGSPDRDAGRLHSWKEIATYLQRGVTTVQRWESEEGLPVHRLRHAKRGSVFAFKEELDAWLSTGSEIDGVRVPSHVVPLSEPDAIPTTSGGRVSKAFPGAIAGIALAIAAVIGVIWGNRDGASTVSERDSLTAPMVPQPLANDAGGQFEPSLSPDGTEVVYSIQGAR